ncbi:ISL3 family transposase, partial [Shewanella sp. C31]|nr:ISL3 family transposase [Shewanella electrica]
RYKCLSCDKPFLQPPPPHIYPNTTMTVRLVEFIQRRSLIRTFSWVADEVGVDEKSVRLIFNTYADYLEAVYTIETGEWLGIDEIFVLRKHR